MNVWTDVAPFSVGDVLSEQILDSMQGNADYVRDEWRAGIVLAQPGIADGFEASIGLSAPTAYRFAVTHGSSTFTTTPVEYTQTLPDLNWRGLSILDQAWSSPTGGSSGDLTIFFEHNATYPSGSFTRVSTPVALISQVIRKKDWGYFSMWVRSRAHANARRFGIPQTNFVWIEISGLTVVGSYLAEGFAP